MMKALHAKACGAFFLCRADEGQQLQIRLSPINGTGHDSSSTLLNALSLAWIPPPPSSAFRPRCRRRPT